MGNIFTGGSSATGAGAETTTSDLLARTRDIVSEETPDFYDDASEILANLNDGILRAFKVLEVLPRPFAGSTVAGSPEVALSNIRVAKWHSLFFNTIPLYPMTDTEYARAIAQSGTPSHYSTDFLNSVGGQQITLYPTPSISSADALTGMYFAIPAALVATGTVVNPTWHAEFHFLPCWWAAAILLRKDHMPVEAAECEARFYAEIDRYSKTYHSTRPDRSEHVRYMGEGPSNAAMGTWPFEVTM